MATIQIFSGKDYSLLDTIQATAPREWVLNSVSTCNWEMSTLDPKCNERNLQYGNIVYIQHPTLPDWVGFLDSDPNADGRTWSSEGKLKVHALSAEVLFEYCDLEIETMRGTAGTLYVKIINKLNEQQVVAPLFQGDIYLDGAERTHTAGGSALSSVETIGNRSDNDWNVTAEIEGNHIRLLANWYASLGDAQDRLLSENNLEFKDDIFRETGRIRNVIRGYGDASTSNTRVTVVMENEDSIGLYGKRSASIVFSGNRELSTLKENVRTALKNYSFPRKSFSFDIVNQDGLYNLVGLGNTFPFHLDKVGFSENGFGTSGRIRITAFSFDDETENSKITTNAEVLEDAQNS